MHLLKMAFAWHIIGDMCDSLIDVFPIVLYCVFYVCIAQDCGTAGLVQSLSMSSYDSEEACIMNHERKQILDFF